MSQKRTIAQGNAWRIIHLSDHPDKAFLDIADVCNFSALMQPEVQVQSSRIELTREQASLILNWVNNSV